MSHITVFKVKPHTKKMLIYDRKCAKQYLNFCEIPHELKLPCIFDTSVITSYMYYFVFCVEPLKCWIHLPSTELLIEMVTVGRPTPLQLFLRYEISLRSMSNNNLRSCWK